MDGEGTYAQLLRRVQISGTIQTVTCILVLLLNTTAAHANGYSSLCLDTHI